MDQLKEFLQQAIKYRFWIAVGLSCLLPLIAYFMSYGALAEAEKKEVVAIKSAAADVKPYENGIIYNNQWKDAVSEKTTALTSDVNVSWKKLYDRQAPLLTWPKEVEADFHAWGRKYPEVDGKPLDYQRVNETLIRYGMVYPNYVDEIYKTFQPFDTKTGKGIVAAPPESLLLAPEEFEESDPPTLGRVWAAQEKLWIQRTLLDVVAKVNEKAKATSWDNAIVKQILSIEVANADAQDQRSLAKGDVLTPAPDILRPGQAAPEPTKDASGAFGASTKSSGTVEYLPSPNPDQFFVVPVAMSVYIDQDRINDFLVEFQNSPMAIQVLEVELMRPIQPVEKPKKGQDQSSFAGTMGGGGGRGSLLGSSVLGKMGGGRFDESYKGGGQNALYSQFSKGGSNLMGGGGRANETKGPKTREGGKDVASETLKNLNEKKKPGAKKEEEEPKEEIPVSNPYFNVVEVRIKGQARFYNPPKGGPAETTSPGTPAEAPKAEAPKAEAGKEDAPKAEAPAKAEPSKDEPAKGEAPKNATPPGEAPKTDAKPEPGKADMPKDAEPPKGEAPKGDAAGKADDAKPEPPKGEAPKVEAPKGEAPKGDAPKGDTPKGDTPKGDAPKDDPANSKNETPKPKG